MKVNMYMEPLLMIMKSTFTTMVTVNLVIMNKVMEMSIVKWMQTFIVTVQGYALCKFQRQVCYSFQRFNLPLHGLVVVPGYSLILYTTLEMFLLLLLSG